MKQRIAANDTSASIYQCILQLSMRLNDYLTFTVTNLSLRQVTEVNYPKSARVSVRSVVCKVIGLLETCLNIEN